MRESNKKPRYRRMPCGPSRNLELLDDRESIFEKKVTKCFIHHLILGCCSSDDLDRGRVAGDRVVHSKQRDHFYASLRDENPVERSVRIDDDQDLERRRFSLSDPSESRGDMGAWAHVFQTVSLSVLGVTNPTSSSFVRSLSMCARFSTPLSQLFFALAIAHSVRQALPTNAIGLQRDDTLPATASPDRSSSQSPCTRRILVLSV